MYDVEIDITCLVISKCFVLLFENKTMIALTSILLFVFISAIYFGFYSMFVSRMCACKSVYVASNYAKC